MSQTALEDIRDFARQWGQSKKLDRDALEALLASHKIEPYIDIQTAHPGDVVGYLQHLDESLEIMSKPSFLQAVQEMKEGKLIKMTPNYLKERGFGPED